MKPLFIHPGSAFAGAVVLGLVLFCVSAAQESSRQAVSQTTFTPVFPAATPIKVEVTNLSDIVLEGVWSEYSADVRNGVLGTASHTNLTRSIPSGPKTRP